MRVSGWFDGVMVNLRKGECPVGTEDDRGTSGSNWREASCATMTFYDKDGNKLTTIRSGPMPEKNKLKRKRWLVAEFELILNKCPDVTFVAMADGAFDNGRFLSAQNPDVDVLDFSHATTHLSQASE